MKLLIVEPISSGHHMALYVRLLAREAYRRKWSIGLLTSKKAASSPSFNLVRDEVNNQNDLYLMDDVDLSTNNSALSLLLNQLKYYKAIKHAFKKISQQESPDYIYVTNIDHFDKVAPLFPSIFGKSNFSGMLMTIKFHRKEMGIGQPSRSDFIYKKLFLKLLGNKRLDHLMVLDEPFIKYATCHKNKKYSKICFVPDVGELRGVASQSSAKYFFGIPDKNYVITVYGQMSEKKGIKNIILAIKKINIKNITVLLAGKHDDYIRKLIQSSDAQDLISNRQLIVSSGFQNDLQEYNAFKSSDCVWIGYVGSHFGSSGVLYQSASLGLPVLGCNSGLIGWLIKQYDIGISFNPVDIIECARAIERMFTNKQHYRKYSKNIQKLSIDHSARKFGEAICDQIESRYLNINE